MMTKNYLKLMFTRKRILIAAFCTGISGYVGLKANEHYKKRNMPCGEEKTIHRICLGQSGIPEYDIPSLREISNNSNRFIPIHISICSEHSKFCVMERLITEDLVKISPQIKPNEPTTKNIFKVKKIFKMHENLIDKNDFVRAFGCERFINKLIEEILESKSKVLLLSDFDEVNSKLVQIVEQFERTNGEVFFKPYAKTLQNTGVKTFEEILCFENLNEFFKSKHGIKKLELLNRYKKELEILKALEYGKPSFMQKIYLLKFMWRESNKKFAENLRNKLK